MHAKRLATHHISSAPQIIFRLAARHTLDHHDDITLQRLQSYLKKLRNSLQIYENSLRRTTTLTLSYCFQRRTLEVYLDVDVDMADGWTSAPFLLN
ncbi:uncharacterized protein PHALS_06637 [Plasmopara halstedii]|uniref:Uncharacterized protein n=1 Tax=Plasmopara halstedii TaxID=4781 RepID=A0A0P1B3D6_PLAHL|nr:uncharacterized protein PHALS_06637 [Plasmopara halstedii]CEG48837.1 hypothetical protein PHALS_06637 [Plasmopara halstedii]|eukprot:XP_024585206.1 hypothetical protein PHALS_06637 [Plasmopara halstedii]